MVGGTTASGQEGKCDGKLTMTKGPNFIERQKVIFELEESDWHNHATESLWSLPRGPKVFQLDNIPFYVYGIALGDIVKVTGGNGNYSFDHVVTRSGHSTYRVFVEESAERAIVEAMILGLVKLGCEIERADDYFIAIDVPPDVDVFAVYTLLEDGEDAQVWDFEEGFCGHPVKSVS